MGILPVVLVLIPVLWGMASRPAAVAAQPALPDAVLALLPADARVAEGFLADLTNDGERDWAVMYLTPRAGSAFAANAHVTVLIATTEGWRVSLTITEEFAPGGAIARARIGDRHMLQVTFYVGAHSGSLSLYLWDDVAGGFAEVLHEGSNSAAFDVGEHGVITWFSPYCGSYAQSPLLFRAHWWDGTAFVRDDGRVPDLIAATVAEFEAALSGPTGEAAYGRACLFDALAYLARAAGDGEAVSRLCAAALAEEPDAGPGWLVCGTSP